MDRLKRYAMILVGVFLSAASLSIFLAPNGISAGGFSGIAMVLHQFFNFIPIGILLLILNIPLFIGGFMKLGKEFVAVSFICTVIFSLVVDYLPLPAINTSDMMLAAVFGGVGSGVGFGLVLKAGATTGGMDMLARLVSLKIRQFPVGQLIFFMDVIVVLSSIVFIGIEPGMYAIIAVFISGKLIDFIVEGTNRSKAFFIITGKPDEISSAIMEKLERGVTEWHGKGLYSGHDKTILLCAINDRAEVMDMKAIIKKIDRRAFVLIADMTEVLGEGFYDITEER